MPAINEVRDALNDALIALVNASFTGLPIAFDNKSFDPQGIPEFLRSSVQHTSGTGISLGINSTRRSGTWFVQVFTPLDTDMRRSDEIVQAIANLMKRWPRYDIRIQDPTPNEIGPTDTNWFQVNISATFSYDDDS